MDQETRVPNDFWIKKADYDARCWVQGSKRYRLNDGTYRTDPIVGNFHARFQEHPWVREAIAEGWDRDLRGHIVFAVRKHIMAGGHPAALTIESLMPPKEWIEAAKDQARRANEAEQWRKCIEAEYGSMENYFNKTAGKRQHGAASAAGVAKQVLAALSERSRAMSGDQP